MKRTLLLVEDDADTSTLAVRALGPFRDTHDVAIVRDGAEALEYLFCVGAYAGREPSPPAVVFLDLNLPKLSGLDVLRRLRADERTKHLPVVVLTSSDTEQDISRSYGLGANSYVRKPADFDRFSDTVRQLGLYWLSVNQVPQRGS